MLRIIKGPGLSLSGGTISGPLTITGAFTSLGIDDNATAERLQIADTEITLGASGGNYGVINAVNDQSTTISGGDTETTGGNITFFGGTHATQANDIELRGGATLQAFYDDSASTWDFQANILLTSSKIGVGGATPTSTGFNPAANSDAAFQASGSFGGGFVLKDGAGHAGMWMESSGTVMKLGIGGASGLGSNIQFTATEIALTQGTADNGFINFNATIDADATSAISSLTTSGAVSHHLQVQINGTPFWIAGSTTDPS